MIRQAIVSVVALFIVAAVALAADKEVKGKVLKVDVAKHTITVQTDEGRKTYTVNDDTQYMGPKGGKSDDGIKDDRLAKGAEVTLVIAGNNRTVRAVRLPERRNK
jgi:hypothetical protein